MWSTARIACGAVFVATVVSSPALAENPVVGGDDGSRSAQWLYDSPLCVIETITALGGGLWEYAYEFENVDSNHLWHFGVWSNLNFANSTGTWPTHPFWSHAETPIESVYDAYDARNLDPNITYVAITFGPDWPKTTDPINPGEYVTRFTFVSDQFDNNTKYYFYETLESGYAVFNGGFLAAVGQTCKPTPIRQDSWGRIKTLYKR